MGLSRPAGLEAPWCPVHLVDLGAPQGPGNPLALASQGRQEAKQSRTLLPRTTPYTTRRVPDTCIVSPHRGSSGVPKPGLRGNLMQQREGSRLYRLRSMYWRYSLAPQCSALEARRLPQAEEARAGSEAAARKERMKQRTLRGGRPGQACTSRGCAACPPTGRTARAAPVSGPPQHLRSSLHPQHGRYPAYTPQHGLYPAYTLPLAEPRLAHVVSVSGLVLFWVRREGAHSPAGGSPARGIVDAPRKPSGGEGGRLPEPKPRRRRPLKGGRASA